MNDIIEKGLRLNAVTGPNVKAPAVSPDTLRELAHPYYGFLQTYRLQGASKSWHGQLRNIGMQYRIPFSILLPPNVTEMLELNNDDTLILKPSLLSEARRIHYKKITVDQTLLNTLPTLQLGMEIGDTTLYKLGGIAIELIQWAPEGCYYGPGTHLIETDQAPGLSFTPENIADEVVTDLGTLHPSIQNNDDNEQSN